MRAAISAAFRAADGGGTLTCPRLSTMSEIQTEQRVRHGRWWHESEVLLLIALVIGAYFLRAGDLTIRGEESRWATVAREMIDRGDGIVPRQQGEAFLSRPPLGNWLIAAAALVRGQCDVWAIRLPTLLAVLATTLLVYAVGRSFLSRLGALAAALAFATMGEVLQMGRVAETDLLFACLLSAAVLSWLRGESRGGPTTAAWCASYALTALAALAKGPQAPVYFVATVSIYLGSRRDWRRLFSLAHLYGLGVFVAIISAWQIPFLQRAGWEATIKIWTGDSAARFTNIGWRDVAAHLLTYPMEVIGCTAPWSLVAAAFLSRRFRDAVRDRSPQVRFLCIYMVVGFIPCWMSPGGMTRYCLPLYPALALLIGLVVERVPDLELSSRLAFAWNCGWKLFAASFVLLALAVVFVSMTHVPQIARPWAQFKLVVLAFGAIALLGGRLLAAVTAVSGRKQVRHGVVALAMLMAVTYAGVIVNALSARSNDPRPEIAHLKQSLPADQKLVSLNGVHHLFAYLYARPIEPRQIGDGGADFEWFCFNSVGDYRPPLPFAWREVAVIAVDRNRHPTPENIVVIGRRQPHTSSLAAR